MFKFKNPFKKERQEKAKELHMLKTLPPVDYDQTFNHTLKMIPIVLKEFPESKKIKLGEVFEKSLLKIIKINTGVEFDKLDVSWNNILTKLIDEKYKETSLLNNEQLEELQEHVTNNLYYQNKVFAEELRELTLGTLSKEKSSSNDGLTSVYIDEDNIKTSPRRR